MRLTGTTFIIAAAIALVSNLSTAQAGVIVGDDSVFGTGSITIDTDTGLEWLDWTESTNRSYDDVSGEFGAGGDFEGWRHATRDEVGTLLTNMDVGLPLGRFPDIGYIRDGGYSAREAIGYLGGTQLASGEMITQAITSNIEFGIFPGDRYPVIAGVLEYFGGTRAGTDIIPSRAWGSPIIGHALVRGGAVPEPTSIICWFGLGLAGLSRRRKS